MVVEGNNDNRYDEKQCNIQEIYENDYNNIEDRVVNSNKNQDDEEDSTSSNADLLVEYKSIFNDEVEEAITFSYHITPSTKRSFNLSTLLFPENLAPIFSGCEWAGTRLWKASIRCIEYVHTHYEKELNGATLLELGCGLGIPGMIARCLGAKSVLTDQSNLLSQLNHNISQNFTREEIDGELIQAKELDWSSIQNMKSLVSSLNIQGFDIVLNCDCVYEPLYGKSYILLVDVIGELLRMNPKCIVITSVERRFSDGIDAFLKLMEGLDCVGRVELVFCDNVNRIQIYRTYGLG